MTNLSRTKAVKNHCKTCAGPDSGNRSVNLCTAYACDLFPFRNGTPKKAVIEKHLQARADMDERNRLMRKRLKEKVPAKGLSSRRKGSGKRNSPHQNCRSQQI